VAVPIAELFVSVSADVSGAIGGLNSLENQLNKTSTAFQQAAPAGLLFEAAGAAIVAGLTSAVTVAADFEQSMASVRSVMSPSEANQFGDALSQLAITLGRDTVFTSREAAAGIEELIKAGIPAQAVLDGAAQAAINLAAATGVTVADAASIAAQAMNAFGISAQQTETAVDVLAGVANASAASVSDLKFGLETTGAVAHSLGLSFSDTAEAIGLLTNAGLTGTVAGTSLRQMLLELTPTTKPATEEMRKLGLLVGNNNAFFDQSTGSIKSLADVSQVLQNATKGMSDEQRTAALNVLFTRDAIGAATILAKDGAVGVRQLQESMSGITAASTAATRLDNLRGALQNLGGSVETAQIIIGNLFLPRLRELADGARGVIDQFSALDPSVQRGIVTFAAIAGGVLLAIGSFILFAPAIAAVGPAMTAVLSVFAAAAPLFAAVAAGVLIVSQAWQRNAGNIQRFAPVFEGIPAILQQAFSGDISGAVDSFLGAIGAVEPRIGSIMAGVRTSISGMFKAVQPILQNLGLVFDKAFSGDFGGALDTLQAIIVALVPPLGTLLQTGRDLADVIGPVLGASFQTIGSFLVGTVQPALQGVGDFISNQLIPRVQELAANALPTLLQASQNIQAFWDTGLRPAFEAAVGFVVDQVIPRLTDLKTALTDTVVPSVGEFFNSLGGGLQSIASGVEGSDAISTFFTNLGASLSAFGTQVSSLQPLFAAIGGFFLALGNLGAAILNVQNAIAANVFGGLGDQLAQFGATVGPQVPAIAAAGEAVQTIGQQLQGVTDFFNNAATAINSLATAITNLSSVPQIALPGGLNVPNPAFVPPPGGAQPSLTGLNLAGGAAAGAGDGPVLNFNAPISINGAGDLAGFVQQIADAIAASARRVAPPPSNAGFPQIETTTQ
jgi:TP901 family phage tail tape measure protein